MVDTRLEIRGALDGIETDLFGEREGATAYALVGPLERVITMVVACDGSLPAVSVVARSAQGDDIVEEAIDQVPLTEADCRDHGPDSVDSCELSVDAVNEELVREDGVWTGAVITVGVAGPNCPAPTGLSESSFLAAIAATNGAGNTWNWSDSDGTQGLHVAPGAPDFAEFIYKCGEREGSFPVTFDVTATFEGREFATGSASLDEVVCNATGPDGEAVE